MKSFRSFKVEINEITKQKLKSLTLPDPVIPTNDVDVDKIKRHNRIYNKILNKQRKLGTLKKKFKPLIPK
jgi:hypothetical protein